MGLNIQQTYAKIGIDRTPGKLEIESQNAELQLHQKHAKINMTSELPMVIIDQYQCFAEEGLKNTYDLTKEASERAYQQVMEYIGKKAEDGDSLADISKGSSLIQVISSGSVTQHEFGMVTMPMSRPSIDVAGGTLDIDPEPNGAGIHNGVEGNYIPGKVSYNYTPSQVNIFIRQYGAVNFSYTGNSVNEYV